MARRAAKINGARSSTQNVLVVDAGNSLSNALTTTAEAAASRNGQTAVEVLNRLGYDAVALGDLDLNMGLSELQKRIGEAKSFAFVSANVTAKATGQLLAKPYVVKEMGGHRIALIGITGPSNAADFSVAPAAAAAAEYVPKAQAEADIIILLSNAGAVTNKAIAAQVPGIDLIISGGQEEMAALAQPGSGSLVVQADQSLEGHAGRYLGKLQVTLDASGHVEGHNWESIALNPDIADDPATAAWVASLPKPQDRGAAP
ncbi:MAG TPA: hypothetical protein PLJ35_21970 [Anaerolineae bacterium]|nr:hypothetical protein [Anaerolineae bacterium]HOR01489.1 hypothetical protein [Anaerolineae bacterium]